MATKITGTNTAAAPGVTGDDADTGLFYGTNEIGFSTGGTSRATVDSSGNLNIPNDSGKIRLGTGNDLEIYHDGTDSYIKNNAGALILRDDVIKLKAFSTTDTYLEATNGGGVSLRWDNSTKFETTSAGCTLTGALTLTGGLGMAASKYIHGTSGIDFYGDSGDAGSKLVTLVDGGFKIKDNNKINFGTGDDLQIHHSGTHSYITNTTGSLLIDGATNGSIYLRPDNGQSGIDLIQEGAVNIYHDNVKKFETYASGTLTTGNLKNTGSVYVGNQVDGDDGNSTGQLFFGAGNDLKIYHDGSHSYIKETGTGRLKIQADNIEISHSGDGQHWLYGWENGATALYYDNSKKLETTSSGTKVTGQQLIYQGASGGTANSGAGLTLEDNNSHYLQFLSPNNKEVGILFGDDADNDVGYITYSHTNNNLNFGTAAAERLRIDSSGKVGIGTTSPASYYANNLVVKAAANEGGITIVADATTHNNYIMFADGTSGLDRYRGLIGYQHTTNILELGADGSSVGNFKVKGDGNCEISNGDLIFAAGHGISFVNAADTASGETVSSSVLDEYEEGTWTPQLAGATNHTLFNVSGYGTYTRVGRHVHCQVAVHNVDLNDSAGGQVMIKGLPFTEYKLSGAIRCLSCNFMTNNVGLPHSGDMNRYSWYINDSNYLVGNRSDDASGWVAWNVSNFISSSVYLDITFSYIVAS